MEPLADRQHRVHHFGAILPFLSVWGSSAIVLGILEVFLPDPPENPMLQGQQSAVDDKHPA